MKRSIWTATALAAEARITFGTFSYRTAFTLFDQIVTQILVISSKIWYN